MEACDGSNPDWASLPAGVLQLVFSQASTWQKPGSCLAARVCRSWRSASAGCSGIRLLYHWSPDTHQLSFISWLQRNSPQLAALTLSSAYPGELDAVIAALTAAGEQAAAAGRPLPLAVLRVVGSDGADAFTAGRLLACLPNLHTLQLWVTSVLCPSKCTWPQEMALLREHLAPLQGATQLRELHLRNPNTSWIPCNPTMAQMLPVNLRHLTWQPRLPHKSDDAEVPDLSHLSQLKTLQLLDWYRGTLSSSSLPPGLQQLELGQLAPSQELLVEQQAVLATLNWCHLPLPLVQQLSGFTTVRSISISASALPAMLKEGATLAQLPHLSALGVWGDTVTAGSMSTVGHRIPHLRRLELQLLRLPTGLVMLTGLQRLTLDVHHGGSQAEQAAWAVQVACLTRLRWLSVPSYLLGHLKPHLGSLQHLAVLVVRWRLVDGSCTAWLQSGWSPSMLPPRLHLLCIAGLAAADQAAPKQLRRSLQQQVGSSGCEVVVGVDLDEMSNGDKQMAGWPQVLQQALA
jgi:hypothetical protein